MSIILENKESGIEHEALRNAVAESISALKLRKVLLLPPDITRLNSYAGVITSLYYELLQSNCRVDIMPALGTHEPMTREEQLSFFGDIPGGCFIVHNWRTDCVKIGTVPADFVAEVTGGLVHEDINVTINRCLLDTTYDAIISIGQVVPHEVAGMANYTKNIVVGCGGSEVINATHFIGAVCGMEQAMGCDHSPVRQVFDYIESHFLHNLPLIYALTVTTTSESETTLNGLYIGRERQLFEQAVALSRELNIIYVNKPLHKVVCYLDPNEFKSTWLGNKSIYRTRLAIADGGQLIVLAPGISRFGEDAECDSLIRIFGYKGRDYLLDSLQNSKDLQQNRSVVAHLIHGSAEGRFEVCYAVQNLSRDEVESVGYSYAQYHEAAIIYSQLKDGFNKVNDEDIYYISNPALGLWSTKE